MFAEAPYVSAMALSRTSSSSSTASSSRRSESLRDSRSEASPFGFHDSTSFAGFSASSLCLVRAVTAFRLVLVTPASAAGPSAQQTTILLRGLLRVA